MTIFNLFSHAIGIESVLTHIHSCCAFLKKVEGFKAQGLELGLLNPLYHDLVYNIDNSDTRSASLVVTQEVRPHLIVKIHT